MNIALVIPTRGDRPKFLQQCHKLIARQTLKPKEIIVVDYAPKGQIKDVTQRYRRGIQEATKRGCNCAVFWEDDDWYHPTYLDWLVKNWIKHKRPQVFGVGETYYYHIGATARLYMGHNGRTSAFCTLVSLPYRGSWPADTYPFLDMHFHKMGLVNTIKFPPNKILAIGIKHGVGLTGGGGHNSRFRWDMIGKQAREWFVQNMDEELSFYDKLASTLPKQPSAQKRPPNRGLGHTTSGIKGRHNGKRIIRQEVTSANSNTQLRRRGRKIIKIRRK